MFSYTYFYNCNQMAERYKKLYQYYNKKLCTLLIFLGIYKILFFSLQILCPLQKLIYITHVK